MQVIDIRAARARTGQEAARQSQITMLNYGPTRSGRTEFLATFPRPLFLAEHSEQGWLTIQNMPAAKFFEPDVEPLVWSIEKPEDMMAAIAKIPGEVAAGRVRTLGIDSLSFYHDLFLTMLMDIAQRNAGGNKEPDTRKVYSTLAQHLRDLRIKLHGMNCNVVWNCQDAAVDEQHRESGPNLSGQSRQKFPAGCSLFAYSNKLRVQNKEVFQLHTRTYAIYPAGGRYGDKLPAIITNPSYRKLCWYLYDDGLAREAAGEKFTNAVGEVDDEPAAEATPAPAPSPTAAPRPGAVAPPVARRPTSPIKAPAAPARR